MPEQPYRGLRILLGIVSFLAAVLGLLMIFSGKSFMIRLFLGPPESEVSTLLLAMMKETGGLVLTLSLLFFFACRDPVRNVAIVNTLMVGLCMLAVTRVLTLYTTDIGRLYPGYLIWGHSIGRLLLALLIYYLRPREAAA